MKKLLSLVFITVSSIIFAAVKMDPVFGSHMVLQQEKPISFFGTAAPNSKVTVEFNSKTVSVEADAQGKWTAVFPAMKASKTPYTVSVTDGKTTIKLDDVLIGEVWFCSGQSNMSMPIGKKFVENWSAQNCEQEVANANYPEMRFVVQKSLAILNKKMPANSIGGWIKCTPEVAASLSATAYFFGRKLHKDLDVPIGLIRASWSGSAIEPWISNEGYHKFGPTKDSQLVKKYSFDEAGRIKYEEQEQQRFSKEMAEWHKLYESAGAAAKAKSASWSKVDVDESAWKAATLQFPRLYLTRWFRVKFTLPAQMQGKTVTLTMPKIAEKADIFLNGKRIAAWNAEDREDTKKVKMEIPSAQAENVITVRGEYFYPSAARQQMHELCTKTVLSCGRKKFAARKNWKMQDEFICSKRNTANKSAPEFIVKPYLTHQFHSKMYNGMVDGWIRLPIRGVIWYQGCTNIGTMRYYPLLKTLIADWRAKWNEPELPFMIAQLAGRGYPGQKDWKNSNPNKPYGNALTRDIQLQMMKLPNVGVACTIDIGKMVGAHPANKQDVGKRLALEAERIAYGKKIVSRGPLFESATPENNAIRVTFKYAENGLKTSDGKAPGAFAIAGADKKFVWAHAKIDGKTVVVSSPSVKAPRYVRYAYAGYRGDCNLQNAEGLPAYPFRSDSVDYSNAK